MYVIAHILYFIFLSLSLIALWKGEAGYAALFIGWAILLRIELQNTFKK